MYNLNIGRVSKSGNAFWRLSEAVVNPAGFPVLTRVNASLDVHVRTSGEQGSNLNRNLQSEKGSPAETESKGSFVDYD